MDATGAGGVVTIRLDGQDVPALAGQSLVAVLVREGRWAVSRNLATGQLRGPFCGMGVCFECLVAVDGRPGERACLVHVADGLVVETEGGRA